MIEASLLGGEDSSTVSEPPWTFSFPAAYFLASLLAFTIAAFLAFSSLAT